MNSPPDLETPKSNAPAPSRPKANGILRRASPSKRNLHEKNNPAARAKLSGKPSKTKESSRSKSEVIVALLRRRNGASLLELQEETGWLAHSVRGFLSATVKKKLGLRSVRRGKEMRRYFVGRR